MGASARRFFAKCLYLADDDRDIDVYHWSSAKFSSTWHDTFSILLARGRAQVSVAASRGDWPKRTQDPGPCVLGPEPCPGRLRAVGVFDDSR
jgi:hypothetical protein